VHARALDIALGSASPTIRPILQRSYRSGTLTRYSSWPLFSWHGLLILPLEDHKVNRQDRSEGNRLLAAFQRELLCASKCQDG
jgi:hypothetical protein